MSDPFLEAAGALVCTVFGAGVAWATMFHRSKTAIGVAAEARAMVDELSQRVNVEKERSTRQQGQIDVCRTHVDYMTRDLGEVRQVVFKPRFDSDRGMPAVRLPVRDERREPSDNPPPPPPRPRLPSTRDR